MIACALLALFLAVVLTWLITRSVCRPIAAVVRVLGRVAEGDLAIRLERQADDEVGQMGRALNNTLDRMAGAVDVIGQGSQSLSASSEELSAVSRQLTASAEEVATQAATVSAAAEQVSGSI